MPELYDLRHELVRGLSDLPDEEKVIALDALIELGWDRLFARMVERVRGLHNLSDDEILTFFSSRPATVSWGFILPFKQKSTINCELPNNEHTDVVESYYECSGSSGNTHYFCTGHDLQKKKCPIDNTNLNLRP